MHGALTVKRRKIKINTLLGKWKRERAGVWLSLCCNPSFFTMTFRTNMQSQCKRSKKKLLQLIFRLCSMHTKEKGKEELVGGKLVALQYEGRVVNLTPTTPLFPACPSHCCVTNFLCADSSFPFPFKHLPCSLLDNISTGKFYWAIHGIVIIYSMDRAISNFQRIGVSRLKSLAVHYFFLLLWKDNNYSIPQQTQRLSFVCYLRLPVAASCPPPFE